jgi:hypothetical protein
MLCQKCGLQEATIHIETMVFRQKIEEHLCGMCAGVKGTGVSCAEAAMRRTTAPSTEISDQGWDTAIPSGINEKICKLITLAKEHGCLTYNDINDALREQAENREQIANVLSILRNLEIEIREGQSWD